MSGEVYLLSKLADRIVLEKLMYQGMPILHPDDTPHNHLDKPHITPTRSHGSLTRPTSLSTYQPR